jgi:aerobic-type carbon monoxide dehydrogenase small subunit (CoxS/CutS family)
MADLGENATLRRDGSSRVSRRGFIKGSGAAAAGAVMVEAAMGEMREASAQERGTTAAGPGPLRVRLRINGEDRRAEVEPRTTLAEALRGPDLGLTGTKIVCNRGACSACTVWIDGATYCSCQLLAIEVQGREITTVEGLAEGDELHAVQAAFVEHDAAMCGFCTPGMVMSCAGLLQRNPKPSEEEVRTAISGNLCRCGTYPKVVEATLAAANAGRRG